MKKIAILFFLCWGINLYATDDTKLSYEDIMKLANDEKLAWLSINSGDVQGRVLINMRKNDKPGLYTNSQRNFIFVSPSVPGRDELPAGLFFWEGDVAEAGIKSMIGNWSSTPVVRNRPNGDPYVFNKDRSKLRYEYNSTPWDSSPYDRSLYLPRFGAPKLGLTELQKHDIDRVYDLWKQGDSDIIDAQVAGLMERLREGKVELGRSKPNYDKLAKLISFSSLTPSIKESRQKYFTQLMNPGASFVAIPSRAAFEQMSPNEKLTLVYQILISSNPQKDSKEFDELCFLVEKDIRAGTYGVRFQIQADPVKKAVMDHINSLNGFRERRKLAFKE